MEDMYDTGNSMIKLREKMEELKVASLQVAIAFHKKTQANVKHGYFADYIGFLVPDAFVIGYGLDYNEYFRELSHVCIFNQVGIDYFSQEACKQRMA